MECILALDAGGSKCDSLLIDMSGHVLGSGSSNQPGIGGRHPRSIEAAALQALTRREFSILHVAAHSRGLPPSLFQAIGAASVDVMPCDEVEPALAHAGVPDGIVLLAGTGAFAHGRTHDGRRRHLDGSGPILGDFGGAHHIGTMALHAIVRSDWHCRHQTCLRDLILERFGVASPSALFNLNLFGQDRSVVASIARTVIDEAEAGDRISRRIVAEAAHSLGETFRDLVSALDIVGDAYTVVGTGGVIRSSDLYWAELAACVGRIAPGFSTCRLVQPAVVSLAIYALKALSCQESQAAVDALLEAGNASGGRGSALPRTP